MQQLLADLAAEHDDLDALVAPLDDDEWGLPTPAAGWAVRDQIGHLWYFDDAAVLALTDPLAFQRSVDQLAEAGDLDAPLAGARRLTPAELVVAWRDGRRRLLVQAAALDPRDRVPWYGPAMSARSFVTARLMETWAHGQDVADALGVERTPTARLRHVAHIGVTARPWSYAVRGRQVPDTPMLVELVSPSGETWAWGDPAAGERVSGPALDFCLVVTQRRHVDDTSLVTVGSSAREWMELAQAFAGPPGAGRAPSRRR